MEEELLKEYVGTYLNPKYNGDWDVINSKFPELSGVDKQLLKEYVGTYLNPKYNSDWSVVNSKFPELFPAGQTAEEAPVKKKNTVSSFVDGGSELTRFDPASGQVVQETPDFAQKQPEVKIPEQKLPERTEFQFQPGKPLPAQKTAPLPKFVEEQLTAVKPELIGKTEENVVPQLKYQFGPLGFKFEETRAGDYMMATSPSGESIYVPLDITNAADREVEANKLNAFLRKGATTVKNLSTLQKQYTDANKKIVSQKELDESLASINAEEANVMARNAEFVKLQNSLESERARLESVPPQQRNNPEYIARVNDFIERADQFSGEFQTFAKDAEDLSKRGQQLNKSIGKYTEMKAQQGTWYGAALNAVANKSYYEMAKGLSGVAIDFIGEVISATGLPIMSQDDYEKNFIEQAKKEGVDVAEGQDFISLTSKLDAETLSNIENRVKDQAKKSVKGEVIGSLDKASKMAMESTGVSPDYYRSIEETFVGGALLGTLSSIPAMAGGPVTRTILMGSQVLSGLDAEMANNPEFADISENEKLLVKAPIAVAVGVLESLGLSNLLKQKGFLNGLVLKALGKVGTGASYKTFGEVIKNEVESAVGRGALTLGAGFLAEAETGALQEVATIGVKEIYNKAKEKEMFDTPQSLVQFIDQVGKAGLQEGIGAGVLSVPGSVSAAYTGKGFLGMDDDQFAMFEKMANDSNIEKGFVARLKSRINAGEITTAEGKDILNNYRNSVGLFNSLPENLDMQGKKEAMNLLKEKRELERQISGKDQALTVPQRNRVSEINEQLTKLSENAIQKQTAGQVPVQPGTTVSQEVAQGEPQAEPQGITQEGVQEEVAPTQELDLDREVSLLEQLLAQEETAPTQDTGISISSDTDVEELRNRTQSRSQQATTQEEKESSDTRLKIIDTAKKAVKTLKSIFPNIDIVIHDDEGSYNASMQEIGGKAGSRGNFFADTDQEGNTTGRIDINLSKANSRTVAHEIAHGILINTFGDNVNLFNDFRTRLSKVLKGDVNQELNDFAAKYVDPNTGELLDVNHEEFLAELTGMLEQQETNISVTTIQKVAALINEFVSKITGGRFNPFEDTKNTKDVVDFFNTISGAIREGGEIQELNGGGEVGTFNFTSRSSLDVKEAPSVSNDSRTFIRDLVEDVDMIDFNGKKFVTNMYDYTTAGTTDLGNGLTINMLGGKNYVPYMMSLQGKNIGDVSNLAAFNTKAQAESFARNSIKGEASLFAPHSGTLSESWQFQQHTFAELVNLILDKNIMSDAELIDLFNKTISSKVSKKAFNAFKSKYGKDISNFDSFKNDPKKIVELLDVKNNYSPNLRKALNNAISADKTFQKAIGVKNKEEFFKRIMDPLNDGVNGGEIINVVEFDPKTFQIVQTKPGDIDHHPSFGWTILSKINGIYQPTKFYQSSNVTESYVKYNKSGEQVSRKAEESNFEKKNVSSSAGSIPKVAEFIEPSEAEAPTTNRISRSQINDALSKASGSTQVATTKGSYRKAANILKNIGVDGDVLDYGAGLGLGTDAMSEVLDKPVDSLEINPERWKGIRPVKYTDANQIDKKYDGIVSLNVVNVVPKEVRDFIVLDIFNNLKEGGTAIISSRGFKGDIDGAKNFVDGGEEKSYIIKKREKGKFIYVFQKGYDGNELFEYVQGLLGDSALVVPNNTFGKRGVVITKLSNVKSRSQLAGNDAQKIVNIGRANGLSEQAISNVLEKRGFTQEAIDTALSKAEPAAKKVEVTEEFAPGYDRMIDELEGVVEKSLKRGTTQARAMENAINYLQGTKVYETATDVQRDQMVRDVNKRFKKRQKSAPSAEKVVGKPKKKEVTVDEMAALKDQIKLEARAAREAKGDLNDKRKALAAKVSALKGKGTVTVNQVDTIVRRIERTNLDNPIMVDRLLAYIEKVFDNANYAADMTELRKLQRQARTKKHTSMKDFVDRFTSINPELIPLDRIQDYKEALDFLNNRTPSYAKMNEMLPEIESYQVSEEFDASKTFDGLMNKYESIALNQVGSVEEYVNLIKDINSLKKKAFQLLENEAISQEEYDNLIDMVGKDQAEIEKRYEKQITQIKKELIAEIKNQRPKTNPEFTKEENDLIKEYLELSDADLESLSPEELFILNDLLENISNGEIDYYRFKNIVSKAANNKAGVEVGKQLKGSKLSLGSAELRKRMARFESAFWEGLLGLGRATSGPLQKFIISPFNRAIGSYEKFLRDGYNDFLKLKDKYGIEKEQMNKIGMLTTYLQEYMAQFDPKNKDVKDIGKRDWFKEILDTETMRDDYSPEELKIIEEIHKSLPKDKDGNVDPKAVYDSYIANDEKFFTKNEKDFFDSILEWKKQNSTGKQKAANELSGNAFKEIPFHMLRSRYSGQTSQITPATSGENGMVRIKAGTGKERVSEAVGAINTDFEKLFIKGLEQTGRDYFLSKTLKNINNVLASAKKELDGDKDPLVKAISYTLSDALSYEFSDTASQNILKRLVQARAAMTLFDPIRAGVEFTSTLLSFGLRARTLSGYKNLFGSQGDMKNLLDFTDSPLRLRQNINNAIDINDGRIEPQGMLMKWTTFLSGLPERTMMVTSWMPTFTSEFQRITGEKFDMKKFNDSEAYREKYGKAIKESSASADAQTEKIIGPTTKAGQRREISIFPGKTVGRDTVSGQILGFFSNYPYREVTEFVNGFKEAGEVLKKGDSVEAISQLQKPLGIALNVAAYGFLSSVVYASRLILLGDDEEEERGSKLLEELMTAKGFIEETAANGAALAASKYAGGGRAMLQVLGTLGIALTDNEETKATIKKMLKGSVYVDPLPTQKLSGYGTADKVNTAILKYIPQFVVLSNLIIDGMGGLNEFKAMYDKVESKGIDALTNDEELRVLALSFMFTATQLYLNYKGTSLPSYNNLKAGMKAVKEEAGVADIAAGKVPTKKKKSSSGGGSSIGGGMNKTDMKKYNRELYDQMYGPGSAGYEIEQEVKAFEKEQREYKNRIKDQVYGN